ncbi:hypothetical protein ASL14_08480 [Paenibacillus sp. IHB B 3084]|nr:hypothetical protein ASL14_08480 [Paenibacillus sp. IHB B 3084]
MFFTALTIIILITIRKLEPRTSKRTMLKVRIAIITTVLLIGAVLYIIDPQWWIIVAFVFSFVILFVITAIFLLKRWREKS